MIGSSRHHSKELSGPGAAPGDDFLRWLPVAYWVLGATNALVAAYGFFYIGMGILFATVPWSEPAYRVNSGVSAKLIPWVFAGTGVAFVLGFGTIAALQVLTGVWLRRRHRRSMCLTVAAISCIFAPVGTIVGVVTFLALRHPLVAGRFDLDVEGSPLASAT